jgi:acyl-coenzyme A synthetase/AMP-(fatty) acid ligase
VVPTSTPAVEAWSDAETWSRRRDHVPGIPPIDQDFVDRPLRQSWAIRAARNPTDWAVGDEAERLTWGGLDDRINRIAGAIAAADPPLGPPTGSPLGTIALLLRDSVAGVAALYAGLAIGRPVLALDASVPLARNLDIMDQARAVAVVVECEDHEIAAHRPVIAIGNGAESPLLRPDQHRPLGPDDVAFIVTTSGSTGLPKLIAHSQRGMAWRATRYVPAMRLTQEDRFISANFAASSYSGLIYLSGALYAGAYSHIAGVGALGTRRLFDVMARERITALRGGASFFRALATLPGATEAFARVRSLRMTGEPTTWADIDLLRRLARPDCRITNSYGATECTGFYWEDTGDRSAHPTQIPAGIPCPGSDAVIADETGAAVPVGAEGELFVRSQYNALGEIQGGRLVEGRLRHDPTDPGRRIYATGDLARRLADGTIVVLGRKDRMLKINGQRVEPAEVEVAIRAIAGVTDATVLPMPLRDTVTLAAFVAADRSPANFAEVIRDALRKNLPAYMVPTRVVIMNELPRLPGGKVDGVRLLAGLG